MFHLVLYVRGPPPFARLNADFAREASISATQGLLSNSQVLLLTSHFQADCQVAVPMMPDPNAACFVWLA